ncbi:MAG: hypothetical protein FWG53_01890 [Clostridiales bacterium]|nr:hypothetical protein [Clostridiales bacterium]
MQLEQIRIMIPDELIEYADYAEEFFDFLPNNQGLTEEFLYAHQHTQKETIGVYSTSDQKVGVLDYCEEICRLFSVLQGPLLIVARKGYAGRLYVAADRNLIIHEDAYAVAPKIEYAEKINIDWFAQHYSIEFQANRTSTQGIGDFPRERFKKMKVVIPKIEFQNELADIYKRRNTIVKQWRNLQNTIETSVDAIITRHKVT